MRAVGDLPKEGEHPFAALAKETPLGAFSITMGLAGLGLAWARADTVWHHRLPVDQFLFAVAALVFIATLMLVLFRLMVQSKSVAEELSDIGRSSTAATLPMAMMLLAGGTLVYAPGVASLIWLTALAIHLALTGLLLWTWSFGGSGIHLNDVGPDWILPTGGLLLLPHVGVPLGFEDLSWALFLLGLVLWALVFGAVLMRLLVGKPLKRSLRPRYVIAMAPPALAFVSLVQFDGMVMSNWSSATFVGGILSAGILALFVHKFATYPFTTVWWSYTFPIATFAGACLFHHQIVGTWTSGTLAFLALAVATAVVAIVSLLSLKVLFPALRRH